MNKKVGAGIAGVGILVGIIVTIITFTNMDDMVSTNIKETSNQLTEKIGETAGDVEFTNPLQTYEIDSNCELAYLMQDNIKNNKNSTFKIDQEYVEALPQKYMDKTSKLVEEKGTTWALSKEGEQATKNLMEEMQKELVDHIMEYNEIHPKLRKSVELISSNKVFHPDTNQDKMVILDTMYLINTQAYQEDIQCGKQFHETFGDETFKTLKSLYGEESAQKKYNEIKKIIYKTNS